MKTPIEYKFAAMFLLLMSLTTCKDHKSKLPNNASDSTVVANKKAPIVLKHLGVDKQILLPYVTCSEAAVDSLLAIADTIYSRTDQYQVEDWEMDTNNNAQAKTIYKDTIPTILALYDTYSQLSIPGVDVASASFVWHEVAQQQMKHFYEATGSKWHEPACSKKFFKAINGMLDVYEGGNQFEINMVASRATMPIDYQLIEAYKQLADLCKDKEVCTLVHDDYLYTLTVTQKFNKSIEDTYSDLPHELSDQFKWLLQSKLRNTNILVKNYKKGKINKATVIKELKQHICIVNNKKEKLTTEVLERTRDNFR